LATLLGRVVARDNGLVVVEHAEGQLQVVGEASPGDWVRIEDLARVGDRWQGRITVTTPTRGHFHPTQGEYGRLRAAGGARLGNLRQRARGMAVLRRFFDERGFLEVETPLMVPSPGLELHLDAFRVEGGGGSGREAHSRAPAQYLITSPEYQLKRLLAGGLERVYSVAKCFRRGEAGPQHNPEFTMVEWYRSPGTWQEIANDVAELCVAVAEAIAGGPRLRYQDQALDLSLPWPSLTVAEAMDRYARVRVDGDELAGVLAERGRAAGHRVPPGATAWDDVFFHIFLDAVEPHLGRGRPTILHDWPAPLSALARRKPSDPRVVERFEAYAGGLELCNGFGELTDPAEQRQRFESDLKERARRGLPAYPIDETFLAALAEGLPDCAGVALGIDRLMMLVCDTATLREVVAFTVDEL
jgi:lysyl-tRNA synthetase class 2